MSYKRKKQGRLYSIPPIVKAEDGKYYRKWEDGVREYTPDSAAKAREEKEQENAKKEKA